MMIHVAHLPAEGLKLDFSIRAADLSVLKKMAEKNECCFTSPLSVTLKAQPVKTMVHVDGRLRVDVQMSCSRCLSDFETTLKRTFKLTFAPAEMVDNSEDQESDETELTADQIGLVAYPGEQIDLRDSLQEQVVLALPFVPLCRPDCAGLCSRCGANLNEGACGCNQPEKDSPFAVLKGLKGLKPEP